MPVQIPKLNRFEPQQTQSVGRSEVQAPNLAAIAQPQMNAVMGIAEQQVQYFQKQEDNAIDTAAKAAANEYNIYLNQELNKARQFQGDPTKVYAQFDEARAKKYDEILSTLKQESKDSLIILALGPTATILAYDLAKEGYQALDLGHIDIEYEWFKMKSAEKVKISNKYTNEVTGGEEVLEYKNNEYKKQKLELENINKDIQSKLDKIEATKAENQKILDEINGKIADKSMALYAKMKEKLVYQILQEKINNGNINEVFDIIVRLKEKKVMILMKMFDTKTSTELMDRMKNYKDKNNAEGKK